MTQVQLITQDGVTVLQPAGELTQAGVPLISGQVNSAVTAAVGNLVIDLSQVTMITTPGITLLLSIEERMRDSGRKVIFCGLHGPIGELLLDRCRLDLVLTVAPGLEAAVAAAKG